MKNYIANLIVVWAAILFYKYNGYYRDFLRHDTQTTLMILALAYTVSASIYSIYLIAKPLGESRRTKGLLLWRAFKRFAQPPGRSVKGIGQESENPAPKMGQDEKTALLILIVKLYFLPLMLNCLFGNLDNVWTHWNEVIALRSVFSVASFNEVIFPLLLAYFLVIDTLYFSFGYTIEAGFLKNEIKSVEPTFFG